MFRELWALLKSVPSYFEQRWLTFADRARQEEEIDDREQATTVAYGIGLGLAEGRVHSIADNWRTVLNRRWMRADGDWEEARNHMHFEATGHWPN